MKIIEIIGAVMIMAFGAIISLGLGSTLVNADISLATPYELVQLTFSMIMSGAMSMIGAFAAYQGLQPILVKKRLKTR